MTDGPMTCDAQELKRLQAMLEKEGIPCEWFTDGAGAALKLPSFMEWYSGGSLRASVIETPYSYGGKQGLLEVWIRGGKTAGGPVGWLTAEQVMEKLRKEFKK
ncbi:MAG: hypothetical protein IJ573_00615 [Clostridia bacterium]|nr:hypothetical protein [Clostridia bacterium]